jgi:ABC-type glycerol-3-phosphate transport system permease component
MSSKRVRRFVFGAATYATLVLLSAVLLIPFGWMVTTALKPLEAVFDFPPKWVFWPPHFRSFVDGWSRLPFTRFLQNTLYITAMAVIGGIASSALVGYGFARLRAPGRDLLFMALLSTMMLPRQVTLIPTFLLFSKLNWLDTYKPLIVPAFTSTPFYVFLFRQFYSTLPIELDEAARIDGCSILGILYHIVLPLSKPAMATVAILIYFTRWNSFLLPLIYLRSQEKYTLAVGLAFFHDQGAALTRWNEMMAVTLLVAIPPLLIFFLAQRHFVQGIAMEGLKG